MLFAGAVTNSASAPSRWTPSATMLTQFAGRPARHDAQKPHFGSGSTTTRIPSATSRTALPTSRTRPTNSWPMMTGGVDGWPGGTLMIWTSDPQMPQASTSIRTSSAPGRGSSTSRTTSRPSPSNTAARISPDPPSPASPSCQPVTNRTGEPLERLLIDLGRQVDDRFLRAGRAPCPEAGGDLLLGVGERRALRPAANVRRLAAVPGEDRGQRLDGTLTRVADRDRLDADGPPDRSRIA